MYLEHFPFFSFLFPFLIYVIHLFFSSWSYIYFKDIFSKNNFSQHSLPPSCKSFAHIYFPYERELLCIELL